MFGGNFLTVRANMVSITEKVSWDIVSPIVLFWTITAEIAKLKDFLRLFAGLKYNHELEVIWQMTQPEDPLRVDAPEIQAVYDCINCSPQMTFAQMDMRHNGDEFLLRDQYTPVKIEIATVLEHSEYYVSTSRMKIVITRLLQLSPPELVKELFQHYDDIWMNWVNWDDYDHRCSRYAVVMPTMVSVEERHALRLAIYADDDNRTREMLSMHDRLVCEIVDCRDDVSSQLVHNIELQLTELHQVLKSHLL